ncbi:hypothetical protein IV454_24940 [Massilia antarctica]|uniref:Bacterial sensory transduction regulator n=1 Tax=Massilia antarctica TaxID=2765360 RepID=A0AA48WAB7_9BURK|nr:hypothetical protein [Massilia antarctica]QPI48732.1 hypothetical protein IV454_24940 [Massilia antarctica]
MSNPKLLPAQLQRAMQCAARCDATVTSKEWLRTFGYDEDWSDGIAMAKYDNGAGDHVIAFFTSDGKALIKGFDHESEVSPHARDEYAIWPGLYEGIPADLLSVVQDEAVEYEDVTFCFWSADGTSWTTGNARIPEGMDDGSTWLLGMVQMDAEEFIEWAKCYYENGFDLIGEDGVSAEFKKGTVEPGRDSQRGGRGT